ncbi:hypothetical protein L1049_005906 [Liquidambar formosana]|uniref:Uncharacterized protein n=1 Tax=Liquidambar formosana TaxID=63359 RepID=A0AAP0RGH5_LIQFO
MARGEGREIYGECLRNHAPSLGVYMTDGLITLLEVEPPPSGPAAAGNGGARGGFGGRGGVAQDGDNGRKETTEPIVVGDNSVTEVQGVAAPPVQSPKANSRRKKQRKTKFTADQIEMMRTFANRLGWTMTNREREPEVQTFCENAGFSRFVFKTWLNNKKKNYGPGSASGANRP